MLWIILCFITALGAIIIAGVEIFRGEPINTYIGYIIAAILSHAFTIGGSVNTSTQLGQTVPKEFFGATSTSDKSTQ